MKTLDAANVRWLQESGADAPRVGVDALGVTIIEWPDYARVRLTPDHADVDWLADVGPSAREKFHGGIVRALPRYMHGATILHASAVATPHGALAVMGESGAGKSTAAALLCRRGAKLLSDDSTVISTRGVEPVESQHWLRNEACVALEIPSGDAEKHGVRADCANDPVPLAAIVWLEVGERDAVRVERLRGAVVMEHLLRSALRLPFGHERALHDFKALADLAATARIFRVLRPPTFSVTLRNELVEVLLRLVAPS
jgi:hypothetical protein